MESLVVPSNADTDKPQAGTGLPGQGNGRGEDSSSDKKGNPNAANNRKRTKTGCLTCRKRRIKCDEGRPTCNNCIKSKRACEGYSQRVVFKNPIAAHPLADPFSPLGYIYGATHPLNELASQQARSSGRVPLPTIAPRPPTFDYQHHQPHGFPYGSMLPPGVQGQVPYVPHAAFDFSTNTYSVASPYGQQPDPLASWNPAAGYGQPGQQFYNHTLIPEAPSHYYHAQEQIVIAGQQPPNTQAPLIPIGRAHPGVHDRSDEEASMGDSGDGEQTSRSLMTPVFMGIYGHNSRDVSLGPFSTFARNDAVGEYRSSPLASELKDDVKRKLFEHFMRVTGPTMSLYERHFFDRAERNMTNDEGRNIWSYTFPIHSLQHPGLLHAMLALASLQVSKLEQSPPTTAHKHYHIALRRVAKNVTMPSKRLRLATLAATLLLAYFEVWNSEHTKWCSHLYGARTLFAEIPLRDMARRCLPARSLKYRQGIAKSMGLAFADAPLLPDPNGLDFDLLTTITGHRVAADDYCLREDQLFQNVKSPVTEKDIENFENFQDLFWWYCKMDVYQAMLGGAKLFMDYENWIHCPPRAPVSKLDSSLGTYDHLMLLLGRLARFVANDLPRKRRVSRAKGSPPTGTSPPFPGMVPTQGTVRPPMGFNPPSSPEQQNDSQNEEDPQVSYQEALKEWECIRHAFDVLESRLGPEFKPLSPQYADRRDHPFGPAIQYRTYSVAGIWMNFYTGLIHLHRSHPDMPPTAMQSVGFSARKTAGYASLIGRIAVGLSDDCSNVTEISTVLAAAFLESSMCLFVAAVQFQDDSQRKWVVRRMYDVTRLTGWQTARQIADGCESAWIRAAQFGRGPTYVRPADLEGTEQSIWNSNRRIDRRILEADFRGGDERRVVLARAERAHYALGLLGVEDDLEYLELKDDTFNRDMGHGS